MKYLLNCNPKRKQGFVSFLETFYNKRLYSISILNVECAVVNSAIRVNEGSIPLTILTSLHNGSTAK